MQLVGLKKEFAITRFSLSLYKINSKHDITLSCMSLDSRASEVIRVANAVTTACCVRVIGRAMVVNILGRPT